MSQNGEQYAGKDGGGGRNESYPAISRDVRRLIIIVATKT